MTVDCRNEVSEKLVRASETFAARQGYFAQLFWCRRQPAAVRMAQEGLDLRGRHSARLVSMVLPLLRRPASACVEDPERQIRRWKAFSAATVSAVPSAIANRATPSAGPRQTQALLHWAYDSRKI